jgi:phosphoribosylanthranilate isomerase
MNPSHLIVKICGITSIEDAVATVEAGADWIGLNRWPGSPRFVDEARAREIIAAIRSLSGSVRIVTLHVDPMVDDLRAEAERLRPDYLQVHHAVWTEPVIAGVPVLRAFNIATPSDLAPLDDWKADPVLVDAKVAGFRGGAGQRLDPVLIRGLKRPFLLAGGLTPENVAEAVSTIQPFGVDVASGVERAPGIKDPQMIADFVKWARTAIG